MKYIQPYDQPSTPTAPYVDLNEASGVDGSVPPAKFFNNLQAEILAVIAYARLTPSDGDLNQLLEAILALMPAPSGAPSDASLVHYAVAAGDPNALIVTPLPVAVGLGNGFTLFFIAAADSTAADVTMTVNLSGGGTLVKYVRRADAASLQPRDIRAGRLNAAVYDGTQFRLALAAGVVVDNATIQGDGSSASPLAVKTQQSLTDNGYIIHPNGFIEQWGYVAAPSDQGGFDITFPIPFPNACFNVSPVAANTSEHPIMDVWPQLVSKTTSGARLYQQSGGAIGWVAASGYYWRAIGK
jgi:hypothetical protein